MGMVRKGIVEAEYDPERALWVSGRRSFLFMFGAAAVGTLMPSVPPLSPGTLRYDILIGAEAAKVLAVTPTWVTREVAKYFMERGLAPQWARACVTPYSDRWPDLVVERNS